jgi:periplasmic protein CpxP/Spy
MNLFKFISIVLFFMTLGYPAYSQDSPVVPKRTPEQEAAKQTDKLQQELDLSQEQAKEVYKINLRYARERQISNKRSEAMERMKNKNADIQQVLNPEQNSRLQSKRYERTYLETNTLNPSQQRNPTIYRSTTGPRLNQPNRTSGPSEKNNRSSYRPVNPNFHPGTQQDRPVRRSTTNAPLTNHFQNNPPPSSSSTGRSYTPGRTEHSTEQNNPSSLRNQSTPASTPGRNETPVNPNRK